VPSFTTGNGYSVGVVTDDPERLVAEALRAHAARTPLPEPETTADTTADTTGHKTGGTKDTGAVFGGYGLLSGTDVALPNPQPEPDTTDDPPAPEETSRIEPDGRIAVGWIILLALLLGLAAGAVVGLVTLL
jgi:hypothetical protein